MARQKRFILFPLNQTKVQELINFWLTLLFLNVNGKTSSLPNSLSVAQISWTDDEKGGGRQKPFITRRNSPTERSAGHQSTGRLSEDKLIQFSIKKKYIF